MHFTSALSALAAALSLAVGADAWARAADGTWVANNYVHTFNNGRRSITKKHTPHRTDARQSRFMRPARG